MKKIICLFLICGCILSSISCMEIGVGYTESNSELPETDAPSVSTADTQTTTAKTTYPPATVPPSPSSTTDTAIPTASSPVVEPEITTTKKQNDTTSTTVNTTVEVTTEALEPAVPEHNIWFRFASNGDGTCRLTRINAYQNFASITIPAQSPEGDRVTSIDDGQYLINKALDIREIIFPEGLERIGDYAFMRLPH